MNTPVFIDTHCHLNHEQLREDVRGAIERAVAAGVQPMIVVGFDIPSSEEAVRLAEEHTEVFAAVAVHPHDTRHYDANAEQRLRELLAHPRTVALGEIGLDYHYDFSPVRAQKEALDAQLALASEYGKPVIFHCREAYGDLLDVLEARAESGLRGVMHCWAGTQPEADRALALGLYLGFGGVLTFKNADGNRAVAAATPLERILLETDAPYLAPVPYRGKRNEPSYVPLVAAKLAEIKGVGVEDVARVTTANAGVLFGPLLSSA